MKTILILSLTILLTVISCNDEVDDLQKDCELIKSEGANTYVFQKPDNWDELSWEQKTEVCNIPEDVLKNMCTCEIVEAHFEHPLLPIYFHSFTYVKIGLNQMKEEYNGMRELIERPDGYTEIFDKYKSMDPTAISSIKSPLDKIPLEMDITFVKVTLAQGNFLSQFNQKEIKELLQEALVKLEAENQVEQFSSLSLRSSCYLIANILDILDYPPFDEYASNSTEIGIDKLIGGWIHFVNENVQIQLKEYAIQYMN